jgi:two-component system sensor histidine kinase HydH
MNEPTEDRKAGRESTLFFGTLIVLFLAVTVLSLFVVAGQRRRNALLAEYEAEKLAGALLETFRQGELSQDLPLGDELLGFGIYSGNGEALMRAGTAPPVLEVPEGSAGERLPPATSFRRDRERGTLTLVRPLGMRPPGHGRMLPRMMEHMMPRMEPGPSWMERRPREVPQLLFLELAGGRFFARQRTLQAAQFLLPLCTLGAMVLVAVLYRNNQTIRRQLISREQLARLGEASRTLSHEIKNPLSAIRIQTGLLKKTLPAEQREELRVIEEEIGRLAVLTDRIGDFLRDPVGQPDTLDLDRFVRELVVRYDRSIEYTAPAEGRLHVVFDPQRLRSVLENLINNAVEAADGAPVEIAVGATRHELTVSILDRGPGIPEDIRRKVFDPFFTSKVQGSGVGLAIASRFVEAAGGRLTLENRPDGGTEARVLLKREES